MSAFAKQEAQQKKEMEAMMKQMGVEYGVPGDDDAEYAKMLKDMGLAPGAKGGQSEEEKILASIMAHEDEDPEKMNEDELLAELMKGSERDPLEEAKELKGKIAALVNQCKSLMQSGNKAQALAKLREKKEHEARYAEIVKQHPEIQYQFEDAPRDKPVAVQSSAVSVTQKKKPEEQKVPAAAAKPQLSVLEIYEKFHDVDSLKAMSVIEHETERCQKLMPTIQDPDMAGEMEVRIEALQMAKESIESDIQNGMLTPEGYFESI